MVLIEPERHVENSARLFRSEEDASGAAEASPACDVRKKNDFIRTP